MKIKYQIFVSSTYEDLKEERDLVIKAILEMGHIPVGMEMFSAGDEEQWKLIKRQISDCDYYVVIVAHRYGSMDGNISYTEKEYDFASSKNIPVLGFIIMKDADWPANKIDTDGEKNKRLESFKSKIKKKLVSFWNSKNDLYGKVSISLMKQFTTNPMVGWIKANETVGPEVIVEISRLSKENSELRKENQQLKADIGKEEEEKYERLIEILKQNNIELPFYYKGGKEWEDHTEFTFLRLFKILAPELMIEKSIEDTAGYLGYGRPNKEKPARSPWPVPSNTVKRFYADLSVLDLVEPSVKKRSVKDSNEYWKLTEEGKQVFKHIKRDMLEFAEEEDEIEGPVASSEKDT